MKQLLVAFLAVIMFAPIAAQAQASAWSSDGVHSSVMYTVRHAVTPMIGMFKKFDITVNWDAANPTASSIDAKLDASSVMMGMDKLEQHLQSADFFDVAKFPEWTFVSTSIVKGKKSKTTAVNYIANGKLTVHGVTKDIAVPFQFLGLLENPRGNTAGFSAEFTINRLDYGVGQAGEMLGSDVKVNVLLEMHPKK